MVRLALLLMVFAVWWDFTFPPKPVKERAPLRRVWMENGVWRGYYENMTLDGYLK
jgi:hypothetical protein